MMTQAIGLMWIAAEGCGSSSLPREKTCRAARARVGLRATGMVGVLCLALIALPALPAIAASPPAAPTVVEVKVVDGLPDQGIVGFDAGRKAGIGLDDTFWVLSDAGVVGRGEIFFVTDASSAGRWTGPAPAAAKDQRAVVLRYASLPELRDRMPPGATIAGKIARVAPGLQTAWIDVYANSGLRLGDQILAWRRQLPIARGRITLLDRRTALTTLEPLVRNASPEPGDRVELWPMPADAQWGRLNSTVLRVTPPPPGSPEGAEIVFPGTTADGLALERQADVYRGRQYIGLARIVELASPQPAFSKATMTEVASTTRPAEGDRVIVRASPDAPPGPLSVAVFRVPEPTVCLLAAGESDGVHEGETFVVRRQDVDEPTIWHEVALLKVDRVEAVYSDATIQPLDAQVPGVKAWDMAERQLPGGEQWRAAGIVDAVDAATRTANASVEPNCTAVVGDVVGWVPEKEGSPGGAIVLRRESDRLLLHVPPGWGEMDMLPRARVDLRRTGGK